MTLLFPIVAAPFLGCQFKRQKTAVSSPRAAQKTLTPMTNCCMPILAIMGIPEGAKTEMPV
jgi:hypothetical protein